MTSPVKFTFGSNFDEEREEVIAPEQIQETISKELRAEFEVEVSQERQKAYDDGFQAGEKAAIEKIEAQLLKVFSAMIVQSSQLTEEFHKRSDEMFIEAVDLALVVAKQVAAELIAQEPLKIMEDMFRETINFIRDEPLVLVQVPSDLHAEAELRIKTAAEEHGFTGRIAVKADEGMQIGNWQFEWANGGVIKNNDEVARVVTEAVQNYMLARHDKKTSQKSGLSSLETPVER